MKLLFLTIFTIVSFATFSETKDYLKATSDFDVAAINSPVKGSVALFLLKVPNTFSIDEVKVKIRNDAKIFEKVPEHKKIDVIETSNGKEIQINVSKLPPGFYQLFVKVIDKAKKEHDYKNKYKDFVMFTVDESLQVPIPNERLNEKTISGIDTDNDGIRDDIQRMINEKFNDQPKTKMAVRQVAMGMQLALISVSNKEQSIAASNKYLNDSVCASFVMGLEEKIKVSNEITARLLNTKDRHYAEIKSNANYNGQDFDLPITPEEKKALCAFNPDDF